MGGTRTNLPLCFSEGFDAKLTRGPVGMKIVTVMDRRSGAQDQARSVSLHQYTSADARVWAIPTEKPQEQASRRGEEVLQ